MRSATSSGLACRGPTPIKAHGHKTEAVYRRHAIVAESGLREASEKLSAALSGTDRSDHPARRGGVQLRRVAPKAGTGGADRSQGRHRPLLDRQVAGLGTLLRRVDWGTPRDNDIDPQPHEFDGEFGEGSERASAQRYSIATSRPSTELAQSL
jgi:hypothetical protein